MRVLRQDAQQISTTYDTNNPAVLNDRNAFYSMRSEQLRNLRHIGVRVDSYNWASHDICCVLITRLETSKEIRIERFALRKEIQPPVPPPLSLDLATRYQIAFANHTDGRAALIDNRDSADAVLNEYPGNLVDRQIRAHRDDIGVHYVKGVHRRIDAAIRLHRPARIFK